MFGWTKKKPLFIEPVKSPPKPAECKPACILYLTELYPTLPAVKALFDGRPVDTASVSFLYNTLNNSAVVPPTPWPQQPHRFEHIVMLPSPAGIAQLVPALVFYPI